jgi:biotin operon repressor
METRAALALVRLQAGDQAGAAADIDAALAELTEAHRATQRWRWIHYVAFRVRRAEGNNKEARSHLQLAGQAVEALAAGMPAAAQARFKEAVPVNRDIMAAIGEFSQRVEVKLARAAVPLGRELVEADYTTVSWTLASPLDELVKGRHERRQTILKRLLAEAQTQKAAPTDADLATALGVSTRTIERDLAALRGEGISFETRRRRM